MTDSNEWAFPTALQPQAADLHFDLTRALTSVVKVRSEIPEGAFTAAALGTERIGNGVLIRAAGRQVILTIGYLITEAENIWLTTHDGRQLAGHALAYDQVTGFGLILPLGELNLPALELGSSQALQVNNELVVIGHGGLPHTIKSKLIAKREFAGYWEYLLDEALLIAPPHPQWGGTALVDAHGKLVGIGSLLIQEHVSGDQFDANLFVPIDLLQPILDELLATGQVTRAPRPWLGLYTTEQDDQLVIAGVTQRGPAQAAALRDGDIILKLAGQPITHLGQFYRLLWLQDVAGPAITLTIRRGRRTLEIHVQPTTRDNYLVKPRAH